MAALIRLALLAVLLAAPGLAAAAPSEMSRDEIVEFAASGVDYSYWWGNGCWRSDGTQLGSCSGSCPSCTHSGSYGADCSGFVAKVWQVPSPSAVTTCAHPYSTQDFACAETWWTAISRDALQRGDAAAYRSGGCPGSSGHVVLYERGDPWGSMWTYEARGCSTGIVHNSRTLSSDYRAIRRDLLAAGCTDGDGDGTCSPEDCDDGNPGIHPGAAEACGNGEDDDCDGAVDEDCGCTDDDGDGYCPPEDCHDGDPGIHPGAAETCGNGADDDCDGGVDEDCGCTDGDGDGYCPPEDCQDGDSWIHPGAAEVCGNGVDDDCNGALDEDCGCTDADEDGFCPPDDCHDGNRYIHPSAVERCRNEVDDDCDGEVDEDCDCTDGDGDGYCPPDDCNDGDPTIHPDADPRCAWGHDDDCDTLIDSDERACGGPGGGEGGCGCAPGSASTASGLFALVGVLLGAGRRRSRRLATRP